MDQVNDGTGAGMLEFLDWALQKGELPEATVKNMLTACNRVLSLEEPAEVDIKSVDVDAFLDRFETKNRANYKTSSMTVYKSRFRQSVLMYRAWLAGDASWKTTWKPEGKATPRSAPNGSRRVRIVKPSSVSAKGTDVAEPVAPTTGQGGLMTFDLPLSGERSARLTLPKTLSARDGKKLKAFIDVLVDEDEEIIPASSSQEG